MRQHESASVFEELHLEEMIEEDENIIAYFEDGIVKGILERENAKQAIRDALVQKMRANTVAEDKEESEGLVRDSSAVLVRNCQ